MNLLHLKYAVEIAQTNSMTKAAENLYTAQPNLLSGHSGAGEHPRYPNLPAHLQGHLSHCRRRGVFGLCPADFLSQVDAVEDMYRNARQATQRFSISVPAPAMLPALSPSL